MSVICGNQWTVDFIFVHSWCHSLCTWKRSQTDFVKMFYLRLRKCWHFHHRWCAGEKYFRFELLVQLLLSGSSPVLILFTTVQPISFDISPYCSALLYSLIEKCCAPAYKGDTKDDTSKLSIFLHRDRSVSASESR